MSAKLFKEIDKWDVAMVTATVRIRVACVEKHGKLTRERVEEMLIGKSMITVDILGVDSVADFDLSPVRMELKNA